MRKHLTKLFLLCMILTSLSSGTLAIYTTSFEAPDITVSTKRFYIGVNSAGNFDICLAPGEKGENAFTITNVNENNMPTEVDMSLTIEGDFGGLSSIAGMQVMLYEDGNPAPLAVMQTDGSLFYHEDIGFAADQVGSRSFRFVYAWNPTEGDQASFAGMRVNDITLYITGTQVLS